MTEQPLEAEQANGVAHEPTNADTGAAANPPARSKAEELRAARNRKKKQHRKDAKKQQRAVDAVEPGQGPRVESEPGAPAVAATAAGPHDAPAPPPLPPHAQAPIIEYVTKREEVAEDPAFHEFAKVFERFSTAEQLLGPPDATAPTAARDEGNADAGANGAGAVADRGAGGDGSGEGGEMLSKRKRKEGRISIAALKRSTERPDVVEQWDASAAEPLLLVHLKGYRNAVPVPHHWAQKRAYLQGKRGVEKKPFQLPGERCPCPWSCPWPSIPAAR
jgi:splicing factor 3B subunit 2